MSDETYTPETLRVVTNTLGLHSNAFVHDAVLELDAHADAWEADRIMLDGAGRTNDELWKRIAALEAELEAAKAREEAEESDTGLRRAEVLARKLYRIVKHPDNAGVGKVSLHYQEPDGSIGVVLVLAPDKGNAAIIEAVEAIYEKQDQAASEPPGTAVGEEGT